MFVFVSHSSKDKAFVRKLTNDLEQERIPVWIDEFGLRVGDNLSAIESTIREAGCIVVVLSESASQSYWVKREIELARRIGAIKILPIRLEDVPEDWGGELAAQAIADFRNPSEYRRALYRLISALTGSANPIYLTAKQAARMVKTAMNPSGELFGISQQGVGMLYGLTDTGDWLFADATTGESRFWIAEFYDPPKARVQAFMVKDSNIHELPDLFLLDSDQRPVPNSSIVYARMLNEHHFDSSEQESQAIITRKGVRFKGWLVEMTVEAGPQAKVKNHDTPFKTVDKRYTRFRPIPITRTYIDSDIAISRAIECGQVTGTIDKGNELFALMKLERDKRNGGILIWNVSFFDQTLEESVLTVGVGAVTGDVKYPAMRNESLNANFFHIGDNSEGFRLNVRSQLRVIANHMWDIPLSDESSKKEKRLTAGEAIELACELLESESSRQWQFGFLSNTGVIESVVSTNIASPEEGLMRSDGTAGQWVIEVYREEPNVVFREGRRGYQYEFKQILVTRKEGAVAVASLASCIFTVPLSRCPLPNRFLDAYEAARTLAVRYAAVDFRVMSVALNRLKDGAEWRFRFYDSGDMLLSLAVSGDGTRVIA